MYTTGWHYTPDKERWSMSETLNSRHFSSVTTKNSIAVSYTSKVVLAKRNGVAKRNQGQKAVRVEYNQSIIKLIFTY